MNINSQVLSFGMTPQARFNELESQVTKITLNRQGGKPFNDAIKDVADDLAYDTYDKRVKNGGEDSPEFAQNDWVTAFDKVMAAYKKIRGSIIARSNWQMPKEGGEYYDKADKARLRKEALELLA